MAYNPTTWKDQIVTDPTKYKITKENGTEEVVNIEKAPEEIIQEGTNITADKLNNIEQGIKGAADLVNDLAGAGRTAETVKKNADDIGSLSTQMAELTPFKGKILGDDNNLYTAIIGNEKSVNILLEESVMTYFIKAIAQDDNYIYTTENSYVRILKKSDLSLILRKRVPSSTAYDITRLAVDVNYVYATDINGIVYKLNKEDLTEVDKSISYGGEIKDIAIDDNFIYIVGVTTNTVRKLNKSDLSLASESANYGKYLQTVAVDTNYIYAGGILGVLWKLNKSNLTLVAEMDVDDASTSDLIRAIVPDGDFIYMVAYDPSTNNIMKLNKSDLSIVANNSIQGYSTVFEKALAVDENYIFMGFEQDNMAYIRKVNKTDLTLIEVMESDYGGRNVVDMVVDEEFIYMGTTHTIRKYGGTEIKGLRRA